MKTHVCVHTASTLQSHFALCSVIPAPFADDAGVVI